MRSVWTSAAILAALALVTGLACYWTPWIGDDILYEYSCEPHISDEEAVWADPPQWDYRAPIGTLGDVVSSQAACWHTGNGRQVAHFLVQAFTGVWGRGAFACCNGLAWVFFVMMLLRVAGVGDPWHRPRAVATVAMSGLMLFSTEMMPTTQIGYIWMAALLLAFLHALWHYAGRGRVPWPMLVPLGLLGLLAGWSQEAYVIPIGLPLLAWALRRVRRLTAAQWVMLAAFGAGALLLCLSPGTIERTGYPRPPMTLSLILGVLMPVGVYLGVVTSLWAVARERLTWRRLWQTEWFWIVGIAVSLLFNLAVGIFSARQLFGAELCALILMVRVLPRHGLSDWWLAVCACALGIFLWTQGRAVIANRADYRAIMEAYPASADGLVYRDVRDLHAEHPLWAFRLWTRQIPAASEANRWTAVSMALRAHRLHPTLPRLMWIPEAVRGVDPSDTANRVIQYRPGYRLLIQSKTRPASFTVVRHYRLPLIGRVKGIPPYRFDFSVPVFETPSWRAIPYRESNIFTAVDTILVK